MNNGIYTYPFHPLAQYEYKSSVSWYKFRSEGAARNFVKAISNELDKICRNPSIYKNEYKNYFEKVAKKYPFTIIYTIEEDTREIRIIAIFHQKREPSLKYR